MPYRAWFVHSDLFSSSGRGRAAAGASAKSSTCSRNDARRCLVQLFRAGHASMRRKRSISLCWARPRTGCPLTGRAGWGALRTSSPAGAVARVARAFEVAGLEQAVDCRGGWRVVAFAMSRAYQERRPSERGLAPERAAGEPRIRQGKSRKTAASVVSGDPWFPPGWHDTSSLPDRSRPARDNDEGPQGQGRS